MLSRAALASLIGGRKSENKAVTLFGIQPAMFSVHEALDYIFEEASSSRLVYFAHPHALNISLVDAEQHACLRDADVVFADGIGVRVGTRMLGGSLPSNLNGTDMFPLLCRRAAETGRPMVLVGAKTEIVEECARRSLEAHPGLQIPIVNHGYLDVAASEALVASIAKLKNPLVLIGMGSPIQEKWASRYLSDLPKGGTVLTVGGLFDFYSGTIPRAPTAWRELGLEWLYRLCQEPKRMARRYLIGNPFFLFMIAAQRLRLNPRKLARLPGAARLLGVERRRHHLLETR
jgi:N-acetylglucosaminyldiphosphoundecaprenol N-acetyl-beta-D-mannosaminyltransferase